jgi:hypothetical protein
MGNQSMKVEEDLMQTMTSTHGLAILLLTASQAVSAANVSPPQPVQVTSVSGSKSVSKGHFTFTTATSVAGCEFGFWLPNTDANYVSHLARVNDALVTKTPLTISGDRDQIWSGSAEKICKITLLQ